MKTYSYRSQFMHAVIAMTILGLMAIGMSFSFLPDSAYFWHKSFGILVLFLMLFRIFFILKDGRPHLPQNIPVWEKKLARGVQYSFYFLLLLMPLSGWIMSSAGKYIPSFFGLFDIPFPFIEKNKHIAQLFSSIHYYLSWLLGGMIILHLLGNLKHYWIDKDKLIQTMWNFKK